MTRDEAPLVIERRLRTVVSYAKGQHLPNPYESVDDAGLSIWRCRECKRRLRRYFWDVRGEWRLRH